MHHWKLLGLAGLSTCVACAGGLTVPAQHVSGAESAIAVAQSSGADEQPEAARSLRLANEEYGWARQMLKAGNTSGSDLMLLRAEADATLARALARAPSGARALGQTETSDAPTTASAIELADARAAYQRASRTADSDASDLDVAKRSLDRAEQWAKEDPNAPEGETQAYLALRRSEIAQVEGSRVATASEVRPLAVTERQGDGLVGDARGEVITVPGMLVFPTGQAELTAPDRVRLDVVAGALRSPQGKRIVIEGFTDPTGGKDVNGPLSLARAAAVKAYLVSRGVPETCVLAMGLGAEQPIATNETPDGRATNRRADIVVAAPARAVSAGEQASR